MKAWRELLDANQARFKLRRSAKRTPQAMLKADLESCLKRVAFERALQRASGACNGRCTCRGRMA